MPGLSICVEKASWELQELGIYRYRNKSVTELLGLRAQHFRRECSGREGW